MARPVEMKSTEMESCVISFEAEAPLLAAGSHSGTGGRPWLCILRTAPTLLRQDPNLLDHPVAGFAGSPAAFRRLCWSKPLATGFSSCPAGLVAGGLESGEVAVWDPREALREMECLHPDEERFAQNLQGGCWLSREFTIDENYFALEKKPEPPARTPLLDNTSGNLVLAQGSVSLDNGPVALFGKHTGSVDGLAFSPHLPNLLGSAAAHGQILVYDLAKTGTDTVPTWQAQGIDGQDISYLSWSPRSPNIMGTTSSRGISVWDISSRSAISVGQLQRRCSCVQFSPSEDNTIVVSCEDYTDRPALSVWDIRSMQKPVTEMLENSKGVIAMSWKPQYSDLLLVSSKSDHLLLWSLSKQKIVWSCELSNRCHDIDWSNSTNGAFAAASSKSLRLYMLK